MRARWCAVLVTMGLVLWGAPAAAAPLTVTAVPLPLPAGSPTVTSLAAANNAGVIVGSAPVRNAAGAYEEHALRWEGGAVTDLHPGDVQRSRAVAVNAAGVIGLETAATLGGPWQVSLLIGSRRVALTPPGATDSRILGLNTLGATLLTWADAAGWHLGLWVAGRLVPIGGAQADQPSGRLNELGQVATVLDGAALLWTAGRSVPIRAGATVADLNDRGQVVGTSGDHAYSWRAGRFTDLGPGGAVAVNNAGQVAGFSGAHAYLWSGGVATDLGTLGGDVSRATAINEKGQVAGYGASTTVVIAGGSGVRHPVVWSGGTATDLTPGELRAGSASALTDTGYVLGTQQAGYVGYPSSVTIPQAWRVQ